MEKRRIVHDIQRFCHETPLQALLISNGFPLITPRYTLDFFIVPPHRLDMKISKPQGMMAVGELFYCHSNVIIKRSSVI